jgi:hypothetical protein
MWKTALLLSLAAALALPTVEVPNTRSPVDKSYRKMLQGMQRFERERTQLAPQASLRFRLLPRQPGTEMRGIKLKIVGDTTSMALPVADDNSFTLGYNEQLWREDAAVLANRKTLSMTWRAEVRSPGVPDGMRRLGDLRLECLVGMEAGLVSNNAHLFAWLDEFLRSADKVCSDPNGNYMYFAERPIFSITLQAGARRATLPFHALYAGNPPAAELPFCDCQVLLERSYFAPIWDGRHLAEIRIHGRPAACEWRRAARPRRGAGGFWPAPAEAALRQRARSVALPVHAPDSPGAK